MPDHETDPLITEKYRYYAALVWNDFYALLSGLDEKTDKNALYLCWNEFYFSFWKDRPGSMSMIDHLIKAYLENISPEEKEILGIGETPDPWWISTRIKFHIRAIVMDRIDRDLQGMVEEVEDNLSHSDEMGTVSLESLFRKSGQEELYSGLHLEESELREIHTGNVRQLCRICLGRLSPKEIWILWLAVPQSDRRDSEGSIPDEGYMRHILEDILFQRLEK